MKRSWQGVKRCSWAWKLQWRWNQRGCLEDILSFLKSPRTPKNVKNWARYILSKLSIFEEVHKEKYLTKPKFLQIGLTFLDSNMFLSWIGTSKSKATNLSFIFYLFWIFNHLKTNLIKIKDRKSKINCKTNFLSYLRSKQAI